SVLLLRDASEKRRIREQIKRADQLALLGGMTARIAHEVRTPLASLRGLVELLQADLADRDRPQEHPLRTLQAAERQDRLDAPILPAGLHAEAGRDGARASDRPAGRRGASRSDPRRERRPDRHVVRRRAALAPTARHGGRECLTRSSSSRTMRTSRSSSARRWGARATGPRPSPQWPRCGSG